ncbi:MAG TPA: hypothetical protein VHO06_16695 [Polyangia bacterium]|nr:hypothetical protein [Polyangia bacterium]
MSAVARRRRPRRARRDRLHPPPAGPAGGSHYRIRDQYYALRPYARYTDPGDVRVGARGDAPAIRATAFLSQAGDRLTVVALNTGRADADLHLRFDAGGAPFARAEAYRTIFRPGASQTWQPIDVPDASRPIALPRRAVVTVVLRR